MADNLLGVWIKDENVSWYRETMKEYIYESTIPNTELTFELSRRNTNKNNDPLLITIKEGFESKPGDDSLTFRFDGDIPAAKKLIAEAIRIHTYNRTTDKKFNIYEFKDFFNLRKTVTIENEQKLSEKETVLRESLKIVSIAKNIEKLSAHLGPNFQFNQNTALDYVEIYNSTFGGEGLNHLGKKVDLLVTKCLKEKPEAEGVQQIGRLVNKLEALKTFQFRHYGGQEGYKVFLEQERKEIASSESVIKIIKEHLETPPLERRKINSKEKIMEESNVSDQVDAYLSELKGTLPLSDSEEKELSPKELAYMEALHQRKFIADAIKTGDFVCLPGKDGYADTAPAYNILTPERPYHGSNLFYLKEIQRQNGFPTGEYVTYQKIKEAEKDIPDLLIDKGQKGVSLHVSEKNKTTGEYEEKHIRLFNVAQLNKPWEIKDWASDKLEKDEQKRIEYMKTQKGAGWEPEPKNPREPGPEIVCSSTEPEKYLGQYLAAVSMQSKFKATPEQAKEFSEKMVNALYAPMKERVNKETGEIIPPPINKTTGQPITDAFSLENISRKANAECVTFLRDLRMQAQQNQPEQKQEQKQEQTQSRSR